MEHIHFQTGDTLPKDLLACAVATGLVLFFTKKLIYVAHVKNLFDEPSEARKVHQVKTPNLGGVAIAIALALVTCLFTDTRSVPGFCHIFFSSLVLLLTGVYDDLVGVGPFKKLVVQIAVSAVMVLSGYRLTAFGGLYDGGELPYWLSVAGSVVFITFMVNAFNLIDGINCLAGSIGLLASACFTYYFRLTNDDAFASVSLAFCGCLAGFLWFNKTPAKIFMGDTGSLFTGFLLSLFSLRLLESDRLHPSPIPVSQTTAVVSALLVIPAYDTIRVFALRIMHGQPPFTADRNHIHHRLTDFGLSHMQSTALLVALNLLLLLIAYLMQLLPPGFFIATAFILLTAFNGSLSLLHSRKQREKPAEEPLPEPDIRIIISEKRVVNV